MPITIFPLNTRDQVEKCASNFHTVVQKIPVLERRGFAQELLDKTAEFDVPAPADIQRYAGTSVSELLVREALDKRAGFLTEDQLNSLYANYGKIASLPVEEAVEFLVRLDESLGIDCLEGRRITDPAAIFTTPQKVATVKIADMELPAAHWESFCSSGALDILPDDLQSAVAADPSLLETYIDHPVMNHIAQALQDWTVV